MTQLVEQALSAWGLAGADHALVAARENAVYRIQSDKDCFALRVHRKGYRTDAEILSELEWMATAARGGVSVPAPLRTMAGSPLHHIDGNQVDVLTWLNGQTLTDVLPTRSSSARLQVFFDLGREMAKLHQTCDAWDIPPDFSRVHWNADGLLGDAPLWDRFWENPGLSADDHQLFTTFRNLAAQRLADMTLDYGLIHADLVPDNVLVERDRLHFIDFDDGGFGYRLFELATALLKHMGSPDFPLLRDSTINGYQSVRSIDITELDLFMAIRAATYVGWNISRMEEAGGAARNDRFIATFRGLAQQYLDSR